MLLAEALALRADQQKLLKELGARIQDNARVPEGAEPDEDPAALLERAVAATGELTVLIQRINRTNGGTVVDAESGDTVSDLIAERDRAQRMTQLYRTAAQAGTRGRGRGFLARDGDGPTRAALDVSALQAIADSWAERYREVDVRLQQLNWSTDLAE
ncbi:MAG: DIP1984 family protein [Gemmatimonadota bacterium]